MGQIHPSLWHRPYSWLTVVAIYIFLMNGSIIFALIDQGRMVDECIGHSSCALGYFFQQALTIAGIIVMFLSDIGAVGIITGRFNGSGFTISGLILMVVIFPLATSPVILLDRLSSFYFSNLQGSTQILSLLFVGLAIAMILITLGKWSEFRTGIKAEQQ